MPKGFPSRPTTDFAKEGLFNVLDNLYYLENLKILDLCSGTGNISFEFLSREAGTVTAIDQNYNCIKHLKTVAAKYNCESDIQIIKSEILKYLEQNTQQYDIIFADPPFNYEHYDQLIKLVFERNLLTDKGMLIIEHAKDKSFEHVTQFDFIRKYGNVCFSFFNIEKT